MFFSGIFLQDKNNICLGVLDGTEIGHDSAIVIGGIHLTFSFGTFLLPNSLTVVSKLAFACCLFFQMFPFEES